MKTTLTLSALVAACLLAAPVTAKEWKTVRFGVEGAYPPLLMDRCVRRDQGI